MRTVDVGLSGTEGKGATADGGTDEEREEEGTETEDEAGREEEDEGTATVIDEEAGRLAADWRIRPAGLLLSVCDSNWCALARGDGGVCVVVSPPLTPLAAAGSVWLVAAGVSDAVASIWGTATGGCASLLDSDPTWLGIEIVGCAWSICCLSLRSSVPSLFGRAKSTMAAMMLRRCCSVAWCNKATASSLTWRTPDCSADSYTRRRTTRALGAGAEVRMQAEPAEDAAEEYFSCV
jgi:hypothetical protein